MPCFARLRHHRHLVGGVLLAMMLALLPLRGWAETAMHLGLLGAAVEAPAASAIPPCHAAMQAADAAGHIEEGAETPDAASACALCALCHAAAVPAAEPRLVFERPAAADPVAVPAGADSPALPLPERPPRA
jgi:hypothetical protein